MTILLAMAALAWFIDQRTYKIIMKLKELAALLNALNDQVKKIATEVQALKDSLSDVDLPAEAQTALDNLTTTLKTVDDINEDKT